MKEGDLILCKVEKVSNTITSVSMPDGHEGTIISSEIAPGRIKLMRQYVVPNKQIVCKVLKVDGNHAHLSLRRVTSKEKKDVMSAFKRSQAIKVAFRQILKDKQEEVSEKILKNYKNLDEFTSQAKKNPSIIIKFIPKEKAEQIKKIIEKKRKESELRLAIKIKSLEDDGVKRIKKVFDLGKENVTVQYISAGHLILKLTVKDFKEGKKELHELMENLEKRAKENKCELFMHEER
jgi:translation initiation factor 2 alpha subunit (eIF-2alpha)